MKKLQISLLSFTLSFISIIVALMHHPIASLTLITMAAIVLLPFFFNDDRPIRFNLFSVIAVLVEGYILYRGAESIFRLHYALLLPLSLNVVYHQLWLHTFTTLSVRRQQQYLTKSTSTVLLMTTLFIVCEIAFTLLIENFSIPTGLWYMVLFMMSQCIANYCLYLLENYVPRFAHLFIIKAHLS